MVARDRPEIETFVQCVSDCIHPSSVVVEDDEVDASERKNARIRELSHFFVDATLGRAKYAAAERNYVAMKPSEYICINLS